MAPLDPSSSKCYTLSLPNPDSKDARLRLDVRTGASWMIIQSRIMVYGGCTIPLEFSDTVTLANIKDQLYAKATGMGLDVNTVDFNDYLSNEVFSLNLIDRNWTHLKSRGTQAPQARMFQAMSVYDNYLYIHGGIIWNNETRELQVVNDGWRYDLFDKKWQIFAPETPERTHRFDHKLMFSPNLEFVGKPDHYGFLILGGKERDDSSIYFSNIYDLSDEKFVGLSHIFQEDSSAAVSNPSLAYNETNNTALLIPRIENKEVDGSSTKSLVVYSPTDPESKQQPLVAYPLKGDAKGGRLKSASSMSLRDLRNIPFELNYPSSGYFGNNIIITGFLPGDLNISMFIYNRSTLKWSRVQAFCQHSTWTHRFCKGFVWSSHHKIILLGNNETSLTPPSVQFFNLYLSVSLPFTNALGSFEVTNEKEAKVKEEPDEGITQNRPTIAFPPTTKKDSTSFAAYSHYVVPNSSITPVAAVFPPYAIALGKDAFERKSSVSDFEFVSSEGDVIPISMTLCRKRWGNCFNRLLAKAYSRAIAERDLVEKENLKNSLSAAVEKSSRMSEVSNATSLSLDGSQSNFRSNSPTKSSSDVHPQFRFPFQDNAAVSQPNSRLGSPGPLQTLPQRRRSSASNNYYTTVQNSRRGSAGLLSPTFSTSRRGSVPSALSLTTSRRDSNANYLNPSYFPGSRRSSAILGTPAKSNSSNRRSSIASATSNRRSSIASLSSTSSSMLSMSSSPLQHHIPSVSPEMELSTLYLKELPPAPPMPSEMPPPAASASFSRETSVPVLDSMNASPTNSLNFNNPTSMKENSRESPTTELTIFPEDLKLDPKFIPRSLCLPFSTTTVKAFSEFLYTGQVGNTWRVVPTAIEVFMMSKFYEVPLLYDLLVEIFYAILAKKENQLVTMANQLKFDILTSNLTNVLKKEDEKKLGLSAIDEFTGYLTKVDDGQLDLTLLKRASKAASAVYEDGASLQHGSISTNFTLTDLDGRRKSMGILPNRFRSSIGTFASADSEEYLPKPQSTRSSRSSRRGSRVSISGPSHSASHASATALPTPKSQLSQSINDHHNADSSDDQAASSESDIMKQTIATVNQNSYDSNSSQDEFNSKEEKQNTESKGDEIPPPEPKSFQYASTLDDESKEHHSKAWPTFKELSAPDSPPCSDVVIDLLVEAAALDTDMKLMLRALNAKEMALQLKTQTKEFKRLLKEKKYADERAKKSLTSSAVELSKIQRVNSAQTGVELTPFGEIHRTGSNNVKTQIVLPSVSSTQDAMSSLSLSGTSSPGLPSPSIRSFTIDDSNSSPQAKGRKISNFFKKKPTM